MEAFKNSGRIRRTPPAGTSSNQGVSSSCQLCHEIDTEDMVQCDICDLWHHFACVDVSDSIADNDFACPKCKAIDPAHDETASTKNSSITSSSSAKKRVLLKLRKLEEEKITAKHYLDQKYELLSQMVSDDEEPVSTTQQHNLSKDVLNWASNTAAPVVPLSEPAINLTSTFPTTVTNLQELMQKHQLGSQSTSTQFAKGCLTTATTATKPVTGIQKISDKYSSNTGNKNICKLPFTENLSSGLMPTVVNNCSSNFASLPGSVSYLKTITTEQSQNFPPGLSNVMSNAALGLLIGTSESYRAFSAPQSAYSGPNLHAGNAYNAFSATQSAYSGLNLHAGNAYNAFSAPQFAYCAPNLPVGNASNAFSAPQLAHGAFSAPQLPHSAPNPPVSNTSNDYSAPKLALGAPNLSAGNTHNTFSAPQFAYSAPNLPVLNTHMVIGAQQSAYNTQNMPLVGNAYNAFSFPQLTYSESSSPNVSRTLVNAANSVSARCGTSTVPPSVALEIMQNNNVDTSNHLPSAPVYGTHNITNPTSYRSHAFNATDSSADPSINPSHRSELAITQSQLAARRVMPKDLPIFSGNPFDWPLFISSFEGSSRVCGFSNEENLFRLQRCLKGKALEAVRSRLLLPQTVPQVIETLRLLYGRPDIVINSLLQNVRNQPSPKAERLETLVSYALAVQNLCSTIEASGLVVHLCNPMLLQELVDKLPAHIKLSWAVFKQGVPNVTLPDLGNWLNRIAQAASEVTIPQYNSSPETRSSKERGFVHTHAEGTVNNHIETLKSGSSQSTQPSLPIQGLAQQSSSKECVICGIGSHAIEKCKKFSSLSLYERWTAIKTNKLCRTCLRRHNKQKCKIDRICGQDGCPYRHHSLLHKFHSDSESTSKFEIEVPQETHTSNTHQQVQQATYFRILPVTLYGKGTSFETYAFLDEGSSITLIEDDVANELALDGTKEELCLRWTADNTRVEPNSKRISLKISGTYDKAKSYKISNVRTVKKLSLPKQSISPSKLCEKYPHLKDIPIKPYNNAVPRILLGIDSWRLGLPLEVREGSSESPVATKTRLGWEIHGRCDKTNVSDGHDQIYKHDSFHICDCKLGEDLHRLVKNYFSVESIGVKILDVMPVSKDNQRAIDIMTSSTRKMDGRYETGLLWKYDNLTLPDSFQMAHQRFKCLQAQMSKNPILGQRIEETIQDYIRKGYVRKLTMQELEAHYPRIWYLPLFTVKNPNKPEKLRIVWDAAAKVNGISLNSVLLQGPDELPPLLDILFKFREHAIAVTGDIREMFHQILITEEDQQAQRFLWKNGQDEKSLDIYVLRVMSFGATCSPSSAQHVKNFNASQYSNKFPKPAKAIVANHYVDDMLISVETEQEAITLAKEVRHIHAEGGFEIRNWVSNSPAVLKALGENEENKLKKIGTKNEPAADRVLGMLWSTSTDTFMFPLTLSRVNRDVLTQKRSPTKREVLQTLMSIFDPLGLLSPFVVCGKILLKDIWRSTLDWDDQLTEELHRRWLKWLQCLENIRKLHIPRCYSQAPLSKQKSVQLHVFVDASESAYAAVIYLRIETDEGVQCSLVAAKTKVTPQKPISIPRLELQAAVLGTRLANTVKQGHSLNIGRSFMWSDSRTVLCWLKSDPTKYKQYVALRIGEILETTNLKDWRWVPTKMNVADDATKWPNASSELNSESRWFTGPEFLSESENQWPVDKTIQEESVSELQPYVLHVHQSESPIELTRFSNWLRLVRTMSYVYRFIHNTQRKCQRVLGSITQEEYEQAQNKLFRIAQSECYKNEISILSGTRTFSVASQSLVKKSSPIYNRSPYIDDSGILRVRGRIDAATNTSLTVKRPILLPKHHVITHLVVDYFHRKYHHHNHETVVNEIRQIYDIPTLRVLLRKIVKTCQICKNLRAAPVAPEMGSLPTARLGSYMLPFTFVGIDYFGPMFVTVGRHTEKRWGVLFTCLTIRAVHIEVAYSLSTDSCILAIRNFAARRGIPKEIRSDNGTNFRGADEELRREISKINNNKLQEEAFVGKPLKWVFNPPAAPHMGGSWERLIQSVKKTLKSIMHVRNPNDELLRSMLMEVEMTVNSRPLTYIPLESIEQEALTPNHFLLGTSSGQKIPGEFNTDPLVLRKNWKISQHLANIFWKRWIHEYLPDLTRRTKWFRRAEPIKKGDVVIIVDEGQPRNTWRKGIVLEANASRSGQVRQAVIQTTNGILTRPAVKLAVLDLTNDITASNG